MTKIHLSQASVSRIDFFLNLWAPSVVGESLYVFNAQKIDL